MQTGLETNCQMRDVRNTLQYNVHNQMKTIYDLIKCQVIGGNFVGRLEQDKLADPPSAGWFK